MDKFQLVVLNNELKKIKEDSKLNKYFRNLIYFEIDNENKLSYQLEGDEKPYYSIKLDDYQKISQVINEVEIELNDIPF